jgi:predicted MFS family arabinose efflux permease
METNPSSSEASRRKLFLPSLAMASFASGPIAVLGALFLIDIGNTFNTSVGVTGQINTAYSIAAFIFALLTGVLSVKFKQSRCSS